jgi:uncharacterized protein (TIGR02284 family)
MNGTTAIFFYEAREAISRVRGSALIASNLHVPFNLCGLSLGVCPFRINSNQLPMAVSIEVVEVFKMVDVSNSIKTVIEILHDGHVGFAQIGEHLEDASAKAFFLKESETRDTFEHELKNVAGIFENVGGTAAGAVHRTWGDIKAHFGGGDQTLLETAEQGEDAAKKAYKDALEDPDTHSSIREVLVKQQSHIAASHDKVKALRDSKK